MCGRYSWFSGLDVLRDRFDLDEKSEPLKLPKPRYNAVPGQLLPVILSSKPRELSLGRWGLVPFWARKEKRQHCIINARAETVLMKPAFKRAFAERRCLVITDGFFEWQRMGRVKIPYRFLLREEGPFAMAGVWEPGPDGVATYAIITTAANALVRPIHDRMPVIVHRNVERLWLREVISPRQAEAYLTPYPAEAMRAYPVPLLVNSPANNTAEILKAA